jgi:hypothetical protein
MNFQGGDDYIIMFVTRQLQFLFDIFVTLTYIQYTLHKWSMFSTLISEKHFNTASDLSLIITAV